MPPPNRAYLRTLIHNSDLEHLEKVVLDGHGYRLLHESSAIGKVTKFLATLPDFMVSKVAVAPFDLLPAILIAPFFLLLFSCDLLLLLQTLLLQH